MIKFSQSFFLTLFMGIFAYESQLVASQSAIGDRVSPYLCKAVTKKQEFVNGIPRDLLSAISLAETGRWNPKSRTMYPWPWTVTWGGKGRYFANKQEAVQTVKGLKASGIKNIDVGCMQINLMYHPNAFKSVEDAFNPESNIGYASRFLKGLYSNTGSWIQAAANYHSTNPLLNLNYQTKLLKIWRKISGISLNQIPNSNVRNPSYNDPSSRIAQVALLNSRFKARLEAEKNSRKRNTTNPQLENWRKNRSSPNLLSSTKAVRNARLRQKQKTQLEKKQTSRDIDEFAKQRLNQLAKWRKNRYFFQR